MAVVVVDESEASEKSESGEEQEEEEEPKPYPCLKCGERFVTTQSRATHTYNFKVKRKPCVKMSNKVIRDVKGNVLLVCKLCKKSVRETCLGAHRKSRYCK